MFEKIDLEFNYDSKLPLQKIVFVIMKDGSFIAGNSENLNLAPNNILKYAIIPKSVFQDCSV
jgi:hypothetical protein